MMTTDEVEDRVSISKKIMEKTLKIRENFADVMTASISEKNCIVS